MQNSSTNSNFEWIELDELDLIKFHPRNLGRSKIARAPRFVEEVESGAGLFKERGELRCRGFKFLRIQTFVIELEMDRSQPNRDLRI